MPIDNPRPDVAAGAPSASGSYTGNGADNRQIVCGFIPKFVILYDATHEKRWTLIGNNAALVHDTGTAHNTVRTDITLHAADGFEVDAANANLNGNVYYWVAIG